MGPGLSSFFGLIFLLMSGAGLGAWVGVIGLPRCRACFSVLVGLPLPLFRACVGRSVLP